MEGTLATEAGPTLPRPPAERLTAAAGMAAALAALHREGRVHGRLHAGSFAVQDGVFRLREVLAPAAAFPPAEADLAAFALAAPEVLRGGRPSRAADVFALSLAVADLLASRPPPESGTWEEVLHRALRRPRLDPAPELPPKLRRLLVRASSPRPWHRPTAAALAAGLAEASRARVGAPAAPERSGHDVPAPAPLRPEQHRPKPTQPTLLPARPVAPFALIVRRSRRRALAAAAAVALAGTGGALALAHRSGALELEVAARLDARDLAGARQLVAAAEPGRAGDPLLDKLRGDLACAARSSGECLRRYDAALSARPALGRDRRLRENALALAARGEERRAVVAVLARLPDASAELLAMTGSPRYWPRWNAVRALELRGEGARVDRPRVYALDLLHAGSCDTRRAAAEKLAALRDPRVVPELTHAYESARASWTEWRCLGPEVEAAIRATRQARLAAR